MEPLTLQKLKVVASDSYELAEKYYSILSAVNNLKLTQRELQLVAFTAVRGNISYSTIRDDFCSKYNTSSPTVYNIISKLTKMGVMVKIKGKTKVNPIIIVNFNIDVTLEIKLTYGKA